MRGEAGQSGLRVATGLSPDPDTSAAAAKACEQVQAGLGNGPVDLAVVFFSRQHRDNGHRLASVVRRVLNPGHVIGCSAESVIGGQTELERGPGVSILGARLPGVRFTPFVADDLQPVADSPEGLERLAQATGMGEDLRGMLLLADPFSVPMIRLLPALNRAKHGRPGILFGGMASAAREAGGNCLLLDDRLMRSGAVGIALAGKVRLDAMVSQGCRPFGPTMIVTKAKGNLILELGGRSAIDAVQEAVDSLGNDGKKRLAAGLFIGRAINEYKLRFGRDDFLIRNLVAVQPEQGAIAVGDIVPVGTTVRMHTRDAATAREDLEMLLDGQRLYDRPRGVLLISCNGRGERLFKERHHDARAIAQAFANPVGGESLAKGGTPIDAEESVPLAGFFAAGEIGPVGSQSFLHGQTACAVMIREG